MANTLAFDDLIGLPHGQLEQIPDHWTGKNTTLAELLIHLENCCVGWELTLQPPPVWYNKPGDLGGSGRDE
jgi:hypothetical protein